MKKRYYERNKYERGDYEMRISVRTRYGMSAMICLARNYQASEYITIISLSEKLKISKIYLEQVFSLLRRSGLVVSTKGSQGGYQLSAPPQTITAYDIFAAIETSLLEKTKETVSQGDHSVEAAMQALVFDRLDHTINTTLSKITLDDLVAEAEKHNTTDGYMYYL